MKVLETKVLHNTRARLDKEFAQMEKKLGLK